MAYTAYDVTKPDASTQAGTAFGASAKANLAALRDLIAALGAVQGFNYSFSGGTSDKPTDMLFTRGTEIVKVSLTYDGSNRVATATYRYSSNSGTSYDPMADAAGKYICTYTYDANGLASSTWS